MQIGSTEALKAQMEKCIISDCKDCPYTDAQICDTAMTKDALEYIESLEERIAIMQESMDALEKRCKTLEALEQRCKALEALEKRDKQKELIPISWLEEMLVGHPELPYAVTDGINNVISLWRIKSTWAD